MTSMSASDERALYDRDPAAWLAYVAPLTAARIAQLASGDMAAQWSRMSREYQVAVWPLLDDALRARIKAMRRASMERAA